VVVRNYRFRSNLSSRPERSAVEGPAVRSINVKIKWKRALGGIHS
jgi:hypothetical protein